MKKTVTSKEEFLAYLRERITSYRVMLSRVIWLMALLLVGSGIYLVLNRKKKIELFFLLLIFILLLILAVDYWRLSRDLHMAIDQAEKAENSKSEFLSCVSHDMRTPLNAIIGFSLLGKETQDIEESMNYHEQIHQSGEYLLGLVGDLLDMSKIETGNIELHPEPVSMQTVLDSIGEMISERAAESKIQFEIRKNVYVDRIVMLDRQRLMQVLVNLLSNAVQFTSEGGYVHFYIHLTNVNEKLIHMEFIVDDNGIGMTEEFVQNRLFRPFEQECRMEHRAQEGTGLGLAIVKQLVDLMGGTISCESKPGEGTKFTVNIEAPLYIKKEQEELSCFNKIDDGHIDYELLKGKRILLCEDHTINASLMEHMLEKKEIMCETASDGAVAIQKFRKVPCGYYDAILMDIRMPKIDGLEATMIIRGLEEKAEKRIPIIALTADTFPEDVEKAEKAGMDAYLSKPLDPELLFRALTNYLG